VTVEQRKARTAGPRSHDEHLGLPWAAVGIIGPRNRVSKLALRT
jgi:hypothetical protein